MPLTSYGEKIYARKAEELAENALAEKTAKQLLQLSISLFLSSYSQKELELYEEKRQQAKDPSKFQRDAFVVPNQYANWKKYQKDLQELVFKSIESSPAKAIFWRNVFYECHRQKDFSSCVAIHKGLNAHNLAADLPFADEGKAAISTKLSAIDLAETRKLSGEESPQKEETYIPPTSYYQTLRTEVDDAALNKLRRNITSLQSSAKSSKIVNEIGIIENPNTDYISSQLQTIANAVGIPLDQSKISVAINIPSEEPQPAIPEPDIEKIIGDIINLKNKSGRFGFFPALNNDEKKIITQLEQKKSSLTALQESPNYYERLLIEAYIENYKYHQHDGNLATALREAIFKIEPKKAMESIGTIKKDGWALFNREGHREGDLILNYAGRNYPRLVADVIKNIPGTCIAAKSPDQHFLNCAKLLYRLGTQQVTVPVIKPFKFRFKHLIKESMPDPETYYRAPIAAYENAKIKINLHQPGKTGITAIDTLITDYWSISTHSETAIATGLENMGYPGGKFDPGLFNKSKIPRIETVARKMGLDPKKTNNAIREMELDSKQTGNQSLAIWRKQAELDAEDYLTQQRGKLSKLDDSQHKIPQPNEKIPILSKKISAISEKISAISEQLTNIVNQSYKVLAKHHEILTPTELGSTGLLSETGLRSYLMLQKRDFQDFKNDDFVAFSKLGESKRTEPLNLDQINIFSELIQRAIAVLHILDKVAELEDNDGALNEKINAARKEIIPLRDKLPKLKQDLATLTSLQKQKTVLEKELDTIKLPGNREDDVTKERKYSR